MTVYIKIIYVNCGLGNEYGGDLRSNEHYRVSFRPLGKIYTAIKVEKPFKP